MIFALSLVLWGYAIFVFCKRWIYNSLNLRCKGIIPSILVGNLTAGGTGKTPFIQFLQSELSNQYNLAILSRGYGRKTQGFLEVSENMNWQQVGDEPLEIKKNDVSASVYVCENRLKGIQKISELKPNINCVLLDDGFQHLRLKANRQILLCDYNNPYFNQLFSLPLGKLREFSFTDKVADMIVYTKCPENLELKKKLNISARYADRKQAVFFSTYKITSPQSIFNDNVFCEKKAILVTGIASTNGILESLTDTEISYHFKYPDHHPFTENEINKWIESCEFHKTKSIILTRKDLQRLGDTEFMDVLVKNDLKLFEIHTEVRILFDEKDQLIKKLKI